MGILTHRLGTTAVKKKNQLVILNAVKHHSEESDTEQLYCHGECLNASFPVPVTPLPQSQTKQ